MAKREMDSKTDYLYSAKMEYLFNGIVGLKSVEECRSFFDDICTVTELIELSKRLTAAKMLSDESTYTDIIEKTGLSTATISRVNRCLKYGRNGYSEVIRHLDEKGKTPWDTDEE